MSDLIRRQAATDAIPQTSVDVFENCRNCKLLDREQVVEILESLPSAERPTGEWIKYDFTYRTAICSQCEKVTMFEKWGDTVRFYNYCPNCGAKMGGDTE